jgi:hypothetical protein
MSAVTVSTTEISFVSGTTSLQTITTDGVYQLWLDPSNMLKADEYRIRGYEKALSGTTKRSFVSWTLMGAQNDCFCTPTFILMNGWDFTIIKIAGTDRAFSASIRQVA